MWVGWPLVFLCLSSACVSCREKPKLFIFSLKHPAKSSVIQWMSCLLPLTKYNYYHIFVPLINTCGTPHYITVYLLNDWLLMLYCIPNTQKNQQSCFINRCLEKFSIWDCVACGNNSSTALHCNHNFIIKHCSTITNITNHNHGRRYGMI